MGQAKRRRAAAEQKQAARRTLLRRLSGGGIVTVCIALAVVCGVGRGNATQGDELSRGLHQDGAPAAVERSKLADRTVQVYVGGSEVWRDARLAEVGREAEFLFEGRLATFRFGGALSGVPGITEAKVRKALHSFDPQRGPDSEDAVSLLGPDGKHERFCMLGDAPLNRRFVFQHAIYTLRPGANPDEGILERLGRESAPPSNDPLDEDITPETWRSVSFVMNKPDGSRVDVSLLRPLWWLERNSVAVGKNVQLHLSEFGATGPARVTEVGPCDVDSRNNTPGTQVVIGKFTHESNDVWNIYFNDDPKPLGATGNHPIFSRARRDWVRAASLSIGEEVDTLDGRQAVVARLERLPGRHKVYNLEVHRDHTFFVASHPDAPAVWVHNSCVPPTRQELLANLPESVYAGRITGARFSRVKATPADFNPRAYTVRAGELEGSIVSRKHGIFPEQAARVRQLSNEELVRFRFEDPISSHGIREGVRLTGGHHRTAEIIRRVNAGELSPDTPIHLLLHD